MIFLDTNILIDYSKGKIQINSWDEYFINSIVRMEFKIGALNKRELKKINYILSNIKALKIDQDILNLAEDIIEKYGLAYGLSIYDAIIAATCLIYDLKLWTLNKKDFKFIKELNLYES